MAARPVSISLPDRRRRTSVSACCRGHASGDALGYNHADEWHHERRSTRRRIVDRMRENIEAACAHAATRWSTKCGGVK